MPKGLSATLITVTAGMILCNDKVLIAKRNDRDASGGKWEFPGGKVKFGESPEDCLRRELMEELGISVSIRDFFDETTYVYEQGTIKLVGYLVDWIAGDMVVNVHETVCWVEIRRLGDYDFLPADGPLVDKLIADRGCDG